MKAKITIFLFALLMSASFLYSQQGPFPKAKNENPETNKSEKANLQMNIVTGGVSAASNALEVNSSINKTAAPEETSSYIPGQYYVEGFENEALPSDWQTRSISGGAAWTVINRESFAGKQSAYIDREYISANGTDWLISPRYTAASGDSLIFFIMPYIAGRTPDTLWVFASTQSEVPSDGPSLDAAFSDTLLVIAVDTLEDGWYRYSASLSAYAGQQIYIGFKEYNKNGCGVYLDDISLGASLAKDIAYAKTYIAKYPAVGKYDNITVYFVNKGYETESFDVVCEIPAAGYSSSKTISSLLPGNRAYVTFSWTPGNAGKHQITIQSTLAGDEYAANNIYIDTLNIVNSLSPASWTYYETGRSKSLASLGAASYIKKTGNPSQPFAGGIYIFGGYSVYGGGNSDSIYFYNMNTRKWSAKNAVFPVPIRAIRTAQVRGKIYIPGGYLEGTGASSTLFIYDVETDVLTQGASMLEAAFGSIVGTYMDSLIYVMGGQSNAVQIYNINTDSWAYGTPMLEQRSGAGGSIAGNKIVAAGGYNSGVGGSISSAEIGVINPNDPYQITWTPDKYPAGEVSQLSSGSWYAKNKEYIFFTGGWRTETYGSSIIGETWAYDIQNDKWLSCPGKLPGDSFSDIVPVYRNDSVFVAVLGGSIPSYFGDFNNEWMYIGEYDDPLSAYNKDIAAVSATRPDTVIANSPALFEATFKNRQLTTRTFDVKMEVTPGGYTSIKTVNSLAYKETSGSIAFDAWTPETGGNYTVKIFPVIEGDEEASNDTLTFNIYALKVDVIAEKIKNDVYLYPKVNAIPAAYFVNTGDLPQSFNVTMEIAQASYISVKSVSNLASGDTAFVKFAGWTPDSSGAYAVKVYSSLAKDENRVNDTLLVNLQVQKVDAAAGIIALDAPVFAMTGTIPKAYFVNNGQQKLTFFAMMNINKSSYTSIKAVKDLPAGDSALVSFDSWTPAMSGLYNAELSVSLFNDEDLTNDTLKTSIIVEKTDNSSTRINIEKLPYAGKTITPRASFENRGTHQQTFKVSMSIAPGNYHSEKTVANLAINNSAEVEFDSWMPAESGIYNAKIYSGAANDEDKTNDTLKSVIFVLDELNAGAWHSEKPIPNYYYSETAASYTLRYASGDSSFIFMASPIVYDPDYSGDSSYSYNTLQKKWIYRQAMPAEYINTKALYAGGKIYVPGGLTLDSLSSDELLMYNPINNQWTREAVMPEASAFHELGVYGDSLIYVIGGAGITEDSVITHNIVQIYNVKSKVWKAGTPFEGEFKKQHAGGIIKNKIVLAGGMDFKTGMYSDQVVIGSIDTLNPYNITWETSSYPAGMLYGMASAACNSKQGSYVIFAGGRKADSTISTLTLAYDPAAGKWYRGADPKVLSSLSSGVTIARNDSLYFAMLGGENSAEISGLNEWLYLGEAIRDTSLIGIESKPLGSLTYSLSQNYPNPFNPSTVIRYSLAKTEQVELRIYNMLGQEIATLVNEVKNAGVYEAAFNAGAFNLASGVYFYRIKAGNFVKVKKLMLIK